jgi:hypothetical protein
MLLYMLLLHQVLPFLLPQLLRQWLSLVLRVVSLRQHRAQHVIGESLVRGAERWHQPSGLCAPDLSARSNRWQCLLNVMLACQSQCSCGHHSHVD